VVGVLAAAAVFVEVFPTISVRTHFPLKGSFSPDKHRGSVCNRALGMFK